MITKVEKEIPGSMDAMPGRHFMRFVRPRSGGNKAAYAFNDFFRKQIPGMDFLSAMKTVRVWRMPVC